MQSFLYCNAMLGSYSMIKACGSQYRKTSSHPNHHDTRHLFQETFYRKIRLSQTDGLTHARIFTSNQLLDGANSLVINEVTTILRELHHDLNILQNEIKASPAIIAYNINTRLRDLHLECVLCINRDAAHFLTTST